MATFIQLRWTKISSSKNTPDGYYYESNLIKVKGNSILQVETPGMKDLDISYLHSLTGDKFVSFNQDYFKELHLQPIPIYGVGQVMKFRINKLPVNAVIMGDDITDAGDPNPDNPEDISNGFASSDGVYFCSGNSEIFAFSN